MDNTTAISPNNSGLVVPSTSLYNTVHSLYAFSSDSDILLSKATFPCHGGISTQSPWPDKMFVPSDYSFNQFNCVQEQAKGIYQNHFFNLFPSLSPFVQSSTGHHNVLSNGSLENNGSNKCAQKTAFKQCQTQTISTGGLCFQHENGSTFKTEKSKSNKSQFAHIIGGDCLKYVKKPKKLKSMSSNIVSPQIGNQNFFRYVPQTISTSIADNCSASQKICYSHMADVDLHISHQSNDSVCLNVTTRDTYPVTSSVPTVTTTTFTSSINSIPLERSLSVDGIRESFSRPSSRTSVISSSSSSNEARVKDSPENVSLSKILEIIEREKSLGSSSPCKRRRTAKPQHIQEAEEEAKKFSNAAAHSAAEDLAPVVRQDVNVCSVSGSLLSPAATEKESPPALSSKECSSLQLMSCVPISSPNASIAFSGDVCQTPQNCSFQSTCQPAFCDNVCNLSKLTNLSGRTDSSSEDVNVEVSVGGVLSAPSVLSAMNIFYHRGNCASVSSVNGSIGGGAVNLGCISPAAFSSTLNDFSDHLSVMSASLDAQMADTGLFSHFSAIPRYNANDLSDKRAHCQLSDCTFVVSSTADSPLMNGCAVENFDSTATAFLCKFSMPSSLSLDGMHPVGRTHDAINPLLHRDSLQDITVQDLEPSLPCDLSNSWSQTVDMMSLNDPSILTHQHVSSIFLPEKLRRKTRLMSPEEMPRSNCFVDNMYEPGCFSSFATFPVLSAKAVDQKCLSSMVSTMDCLCPALPQSPCDLCCGESALLQPGAVLFAQSSIAKPQTEQNRLTYGGYSCQHFTSMLPRCSEQQSNGTGKNFANACTDLPFPPIARTSHTQDGYVFEDSLGSDTLADAKFHFSSLKSTYNLSSDPFQDSVPQHNHHVLMLDERVDMESIKSHVNTTCVCSGNNSVDVQDKHISPTCSIIDKRLTRHFPVIRDVACTVNHLVSEQSLRCLQYNVVRNLDCVKSTSQHLQTNHCKQEYGTLMHGEFLLSSNETKSCYQNVVCSLSQQSDVLSIKDSISKPGSFGYLSNSSIKAVNSCVMSELYHRDMLFFDSASAVDTLQYDLQPRKKQTRIKKPHDMTSSNIAKTSSSMKLNKEFAGQKSSFCACLSQGSVPPKSKHSAMPRWSFQSPEEELDDRLRSNRVESVPNCKCLGPHYQFDETVEGPYYTQLGATKNMSDMRTLLEKRTGLKGRAIRIEKVRYTGKEGRSSDGCPIAKWIIRRSGEEEKYLCVVRKRPGHFCDTAYIVVSLVAWEGVFRQQADDLYTYLVSTLTKNGYETERRCGMNDRKTCACQGVDIVRRGASFSFGCSWSMYFNGCKFARSQVARKFRLRDSKEESILEEHLQELATKVAPLFKEIVPDAYRNQAYFEEEADMCRLGTEKGRPFSGVTACVDFCTHAHKDFHNMQNGSTVVVTLTRHRDMAVPDDEQLHVLPLYVLDGTDEHGSISGQAEKVRSGCLETLQKYSICARMRASPLRKKKRVKKSSHKKETLGGLNVTQGTADFLAANHAADGVEKKFGSSRCDGWWPLAMVGDAAYGIGKDHSQVNNDYRDCNVSIGKGVVSEDSKLRENVLRNSHMPENFFPFICLDHSPDQVDVDRRRVVLEDGDECHDDHCDHSVTCQRYSSTVTGQVLINSSQNSRHSLPALYPNLRSEPSPGCVSLNVTANADRPCVSQPMGLYEQKVPDLQWNRCQSNTIGGVHTDPLKKSMSHESLHTLDNKLILSEQSHSSSSFPNQHSLPSTFVGHHAPFDAATCPDGRTSVVVSRKSPEGTSPQSVLTGNHRFPHHPKSHHDGAKGLHSCATLVGPAPDSRSAVDVDGRVTGPERGCGPSEPAFSVLDPTVVHCEWQDSAESFRDSDVGGVAIALCHGAVLFEVAKRELHATTGLRRPNRYRPTRVSLIFYQHKNLNSHHHGYHEYERKLSARMRQRVGRLMAEGATEEEAVRATRPGCKRKESGKVGEDDGDGEHVDFALTTAAQYKYMWDTTVGFGESLTTDSIITRWIDPQPMVTGPYQKWV